MKSLPPLPPPREATLMPISLYVEPVTPPSCSPKYLEHSCPHPTLPALLLLTTAKLGKGWPPPAPTHTWLSSLPPW